MFKKKNIQFYVGAAVGVTVGLCIGKLLSPNTSIIIENKAHSHIFDIESVVQAFVYRPIDSVSNDDNVSINERKHCHSRSKSVSRYGDKNFKDLTFLMPLTKPALSDSKININSATPMKKVQLNKICLQFMNLAGLYIKRKIDRKM